jgi:hypothetical protein
VNLAIPIYAQGRAAKNSEFVSLPQAWQIIVEKFKHAKVCFTLLFYNHSILV